MNLYFERLTIFSFLYALHCKYLNNFSKKSDHIIYYVEASKIGIICGQIFGKMFGVEFQPLKFKMMDIKDNNGELLRIRIPRIDLIDIQNKIINSTEFQQLYHSSWEHDRFEIFLKKGVIDGDINDDLSVSRVLYLINVIFWHQKKLITTKSKLLIIRRAWFNIFKGYASNLDVELIGYYDIPKLDLRKIVKQLLVKSPYIYLILRNLKQKKYYNKLKSTQTESTKLYLEGRGDVNLVNNGHHSDFFWLMNSDFNGKNLLYTAISDEESFLLNKNNICVFNGIVKPAKRNTKTQIKYSSSYCIEERRVIQQQNSAYNSTIHYWYSLFNTYNVKVWLTWNKYDNTHMAVADAISECGGISAIWQMAFEGFQSLWSKINTDIIFSHSAFNHKIHNKLGSRSIHHIITGYPKDYAVQKLKEEASQLRKQLFERGVKKVIFSIDENSTNDSRWHTGHELQRENYSFILQKVLVTPWLGVIFKPKTAKTLRFRLGEVNELLDKAIKSGRCILFEESGHHTTSAPPLLAGLASDVCIHGHLCAGTAALECALEGIPTLLIDREGCPYSKFYDLPKNKVIFKNWEDTIDALMDHLQTPNGIPGFGDWTKIIEDLDPFRDGKAAQRMGNYLNWLIQGFDEGLDRDVIMANATEKYRKQWGNDKVLVS